MSSPANNFSDAEKNTLALMFMCLKSTEMPDIDFAKLANLVGHSNEKSTRNMVSKILAKVKNANGGDISGATKDTNGSKQNEDAKGRTRKSRGNQDPANKGTKIETPKSATRNRKRKTQSDDDDDDEDLSDDVTRNVEAKKKTTKATASKKPAADDAKTPTKSSDEPSLKKQKVAKNGIAGSKEDDSHDEKTAAADDEMSESGASKDVGSTKKTKVAKKGLAIHKKKEAKSDVHIIDDEDEDAAASADNAADEDLKKSKTPAKDEGDAKGSKNQASTKTSKTDGTNVNDTNQESVAADAKGEVKSAKKPSAASTSKGKKGSASPAPSGKKSAPARDRSTPISNSGMVRRSASRNSAVHSGFTAINTAKGSTALEKIDEENEDGSDKDDNSVITLAVKGAAHKSAV